MFKRPMAVRKSTYKDIFESIAYLSLIIAITTYGFYIVSGSNVF